MRKVSVFLVFAAAGSVAYLLYWQQRLSPLVNAEGVGLVPIRLELPPAGPVRHVDLGAVVFDLPAALAGELVEQGNSLFVSIEGPPPQGSPLTICPPTPDRDEEVRSLLDRYAEITGVRPASYWDLRRQALQVEPISAWAIPFRGRRRTLVDMTLLALKATLVEAVERQEYFEDARVGISVATRRKTVFVHVADKASGVGQVFVLQRGAVDPVLLVAALARSYRLTTTDLTPEHLTKRLQDVGLARRMSASASAMTAASQADAEETRLRKALGGRPKAERRTPNAERGTSNADPRPEGR